MDTAAEAKAVEAVGKEKQAAETATEVEVTDVEAMAEAGEAMVTVGAGRETADTQATRQVR